MRDSHGRMMRYALVGDSKGKGIKWRTGSRKYRKNLPFVTDAMNENVVRGRGKRQPQGV